METPIVKIKRVLRGSAWSALGMVMLAGCASPEFVYVPSDHRTGEQGVQKFEAVYTEPANAPAEASDGRVKITSLGVVDVKPPQDVREFKAVHLRMVITNQSATDSWTLNTQDQFVSFPNDGQHKPLVMDPAVSPSLRVAPGELRSMDYYFPLPDEKSSAESVPDFDFHWKVQAGTDIVQQTTSFDRFQIEPPIAVADSYGPWPYYPYYPWGWGPSFGGVVVIHPR